MRIVMLYRCSDDSAPAGGVAMTRAIDADHVPAVGDRVLIGRRAVRVSQRLWKPDLDEIQLGLKHPWTPDLAEALTQQGFAPL